MIDWTPEAIEWHDRILRQKREREAEIRRRLGWSNVRVGLYTIDTFLGVHHASDRAMTISHSNRQRSAKLAQKRQTHKKEVSNA